MDPIKININTQIGNDGLVERIERYESVNFMPGAPKNTVDDLETAVRESSPDHHRICSIVFLIV